AMASPRPSPFRDRTTLDFSLAEPAHVTVAVFDVAGRRVRTLVDADRDANRYRITWDGRNDHGSRLGSGVYFVRYQAGPAEIVRRVVRLD
ncbi:MAG TPA: FlgD immunoglobulin-like domain containing protein, partial [bacterium]|nr:FlgD immunoglobulin-like domain containing protein [bacterium]